jgi:hypothetical protein
MYSLSKNKYGQLMREVDKQLKCTWWRTVEIKFYQFTGANNPIPTMGADNIKKMQEMISQPQEKEGLEAYSQKVIK